MIAGAGAGTMVASAAAVSLAAAISAAVAAASAAAVSAAAAASVIAAASAAAAGAAAVAALAAAVVTAAALAAAAGAAAAVVSAAAVVIAAASAAAVAAASAVVAAAASAARVLPRDMGPANVLGTAKGTVKFFNAQKGFGFVVREDGGEDVFVHISAVEQAGLTGLADGQPLEFTMSERNGRVSATDLVIDGEPMPVTDRPAPREEFGARTGFSTSGGAGAGGGAGGGFGRDRRPQTDGARYEGTVKFFNGTKGFGFIAREDGGQDAFVHISAVERAGMGTLNEGQKVSFELELDRRGKQAAVNISAAD